MDDVLDMAWGQIEMALAHVVRFLDLLISPLEIFGPGCVISVAAVLVVLFTRFVSRYYVTRRYTALKKEFEHWRQIREAAMKHPDPEKARALAKNIDQAELNRAYYDFFFEGMLKNLVTHVLPILLTAAFIMKIYTPDTLMERFGEKWVFAISLGGSQIEVSSLFWFVISLITGFILYAGVKNMVKKKRNHTPELAQDNI